MSGTFDGMDPVPVHLAGVDPEAIAAAIGGAAPRSSSPPRRRRALRTNTYTLTAANPTQLLLPQSDNRLEAWVTSATEASPPVIYIAPNQAGAQAAGGGSAQIVGSDTTPVPLNTTDQVWVSALTGYPVTVSIWAIYDGALELWPTGS